VSRSFFAISISSLPTFQEGLVRAQFCIDGAAGRLLGRAERSTPGARQGRAGRSEGLTAKARAELPWCSAIRRQNVTAFLLISFPRFDVPNYVCSIDPRRSPFAMRHSPHQLISGRGRDPVPRSLMQQCEGHRAPRGMGPFYFAAYCSQAMLPVHIRLGIGKFLSFSFSESNHTFRAAPSGTRPVSR